MSLELTLETVGLGRKKPRSMFSKTWEGFGGGLLEMWGAMCQRRGTLCKAFPQSPKFSPCQRPNQPSQNSVSWFCIPWLYLWFFVSCFMHSHSLTPKGFSNVNLVCPLCRTLIEQMQNVHKYHLRKCRWGLATTTCPAWHFLCISFSILTVHQEMHVQIHTYFNATGIFLWRELSIGASSQ